jgi:hypothetical protein
VCYTWAADAWLNNLTHIEHQSHGCCVLSVTYTVAIDPTRGMAIVKHKLLSIGLILVALVFSMRLTLAQDSDVYSDEAGRFQIPIPESWTDKSDETRAYFVNAEGTAEIYALAVESDDLQTGVQTALEQIYPGFDSSPLQTSEVPVPGGTTWTQNIYALEGGDLLAAVARVEGDLTYVITIRAPQNVLIQETATLNKMILGYTVTGENRPM